MSWDDGMHAKVNRVELTFDDAIRSIEVEYEGTNVQPQRRGTVGINSDGFTLSSDEFITHMSGYYRTTVSGDVITALLFRTNKKTYGPYGNLTQNFFSADAPRNNQIAGFLGNSGIALNSINVHFAPTPPPGGIKPKPVGPGTGDAGSGQPVGPGTGDAGGGLKPGGPGTGDNGAGTKPGDPGTGAYGDGTKPKPGGSGTGKDGAGSEPGGIGTGDGAGTKPGGHGTGDGAGTKPGGHGTGDGAGTEPGGQGTGAGTKPSGHGTGDGAGTEPGGQGTGAVTKPGGPVSGDGAGSKPVGPKTGNDGAGTKPGGPGTSVDGAGTKPGGPGTGNKGGGPRPVIPGKMGPLGGEGGNEFDDVGFDGVKKVVVGADNLSVTYIKIEYEKDGKVEIREHGTSRGQLKEFSVNYPNDNITAVGGTYKHIYTTNTTLITSLYFTTSRGLTSPLFGEMKGTEFEFKSDNGGKLLGFHGRASYAIDAIGAYFDTGSKQVVPVKMGPLGGEGGNEFNDVGFDGVKKVAVGADNLSVTYIKIEYVKDGKVEIREHGTSRGQLKEFSVNYPNDNITDVGGTYKHIYTTNTTLITSLYLTTSRGLTSPLFGEMKGTEFEFKSDNGGKLIGFHGRASYAIDAIGAYFDSGSKPGGDTGSSTQKLDAQGGKGGNQWDDGGDHDGVTKIHVAVGRGIEQLSFEYVKNGQTKEGPPHGVKGRRSTIETFEISHPSEYLISVKGWSDSSNNIPGIQFKTNTKTSKYYGFVKPLQEETTDILLEVKDKKIVGFHGFADSHVHSLGAYVAPIAN
ncbi:hypothetical protein N665_0517s0002 [Sinapis alba]|nr:hypothetical protein N665_0517s0002 [Sinapis alba]